MKLARLLLAALCWLAIGGTAYAIDAFPGTLGVAMIIPGAIMGALAMHTTLWALTR